MTLLRICYLLYPASCNANDRWHEIIDLLRGHMFHFLHPLEFLLIFYDLLLEICIIVLHHYPYRDNTPAVWMPSLIHHRPLFIVGGRGVQQ